MLPPRHDKVGRAGAPPRDAAPRSRSRRKTEAGENRKKNAKKKFGEKPSKADQKSFQQRRAEVRAKYAKKSRSVVRERTGGSSVTRPDAVPSVANRLPGQRRQWRRGAAQDKSHLRVESRLVFDYEQTADACAELRTGDTPRGESGHVLRTSKDHGDSISDHVRRENSQPSRRRKPKFLEQPTFQFDP